MAKGRGEGCVQKMWQKGGKLKKKKHSFLNDCKIEDQEEKKKSGSRRGVSLQLADKSLRNLCLLLCKMR